MCSNSRGKSGGGAAALSGHQPDPEGLLVYPVDFGLQMARDMYRAQRRVDTLRNYLEEAESVQAGVWALLCVLSRWLNRYEAELPEGVMGGMGWRLRGPEGLCAK